MADDEQPDYDEFGNYVGPAREQEPPEHTTHPLNDAASVAETAPAADYRQAIVLPEHRQLYPSAADTYGPAVEAVYHDTDTQTLDEPIIRPSTKRSFLKKTKEVSFPYSDEYLRQVHGIPGRGRCVAFVGPLQSGKTSVIDMLVEGAAERLLPAGYMDNWLVEGDRSMTLKCKPMTVLLKTPDRRALHAVTLIDSPGHCDFWAEQEAAVDLADMAVVVVDAVEGVTLGVRGALARLSNTPFVLFISKIDRLVLDLKLPPADAYHKLKLLIDSFNMLITDETRKCRPETGTVIFGSARHRWSFSLDSFCRRVLKGPAGLAARLFGPVFYSKTDGTFSNSGEKTTFVEFVLEPIYKLYTSALSFDKPLVRLSRAEAQMDIKPLVRKTLSRGIGWDTDCLFRYDLGEGTGCNGETSAVAVKGIAFEQEIGFIVKVTSGCLSLNAVLFAHKSVDAEPIKFALKRMFLYQGGHRLLPVKAAISGSVVFVPVSVLDSDCECPFVVSGHSATSDLTRHLLGSFAKRRQLDRPVSVKLGIEPIVPSNLPRLQEAIKSAKLCYGRVLESKIEETGEQVLIGTGELLMDVVMMELRDLLCPEPIEIRVSDPTAVFRETVVDASPVTCYADTPNGRATVSMLAEPLESGLAEAVENGLFRGRLGDPLSMARVGAQLRDRFGWDLLAARSVLAVGPDPEFGPNILINDVLPDDTANTNSLPLSPSHLQSVIHAFQWTCRQGPLAEEPVRGVKFRLVGLTTTQQDRSYEVPSGQLIPTVRRACFAAMITATAKLVEPVLRLQIITHPHSRDAVMNVLSKRRGHVTEDDPMPGTPFHNLAALLPAIDSYGVEVDLRVACQGLASVQSVFALWQPVPGDPLDASARLPPLTAAPAPLMARDFIQKTRRRKGLVEDVRTERFLDERMLRALSALNI